MEPHQFSLRDMFVSLAGFGICSGFIALTNRLFDRGVVNGMVFMIPAFGFFLVGLLAPLWKIGVPAYAD